MSLHPDSQAFLNAVAAHDGPAWHEMAPAEARQCFADCKDLFGAGPHVAAVENRVIRDHLGVRIYSPDGEGPFPALVFLHGGGWVLGDLDTHDALCRKLTQAASCCVVSVDYRRAPETRFPGPVEDGHAALCYVAEQHRELNVDPHHLMLAGDSAGGNLASAVAMVAASQPGPKPSRLILIYPVLDHRCASPSYDQFANGFGLSKEEMKWFWSQYLGRPADGSEALASPLRADGLTGLPPTHVVTAEYDVLRDEGEQFVQRLEDEGVPVTHRRYDGMLHGFVHFSEVFSTAEQAIKDIAAVLRAGVDSTTTV